MPKTASSGGAQMAALQTRTSDSPVADDPVGAFLLWCTLGKSYERTAIAAQTSVEEIRRQSVEHRWEARVGVSAGGPREQRAINRAVQFMTASRLRVVIDSVIAGFSDPEKFRDATTEFSKGAANTSFKNLQYLASALQISNDMARSALGDTAETVRKDEDESDGEGKRSSSLAVESMMKKLDSTPGTPVHELVQQLARAEAAVLPATPA